MKDMAGILFGNLLITAAYAFIAVPHHIVNGGVTSFAMVVNELTGAEISLVTDGVTLVLLACCLLFLGREYFFKSVVSSICYMGMFTWFSSMELSLPAPDAIAVILSSVMVGLGYFLCINAKSTAVGFDVLALIIHSRNKKADVATVIRIINIVVILLGMVCYGPSAVIMGIVFTLIQTQVLKVLL